MLKFIRKIGYFGRYCIGYIYGGYLTARYVTHYAKFPAIVFPHRIIRVKIKKTTGAQLILEGQLRIEPFFDKTPVTLFVGEFGTIHIKRDFILGDGVFIKVSSRGTFLAEGQKRESGSGITARCVVMVADKICFGQDVIIGWDTFITDCDWHNIEGQTKTEPTLIGNHVWIGMGTKVLKGSNIGNDSSGAAGTVVVTGKYPERVLLGCIPARILKENVSNWSR
ncbi:MAG: hypothetical protein IPJ94_16300 [Chloroflexi bacterium]|nr:hypothetical protein [Chloroflexota bacterium]